MDTRAVEDPTHAEKSYALRNPGGLANARKTIWTVYEGASSTMEMNFREKSDMAIVPDKAPNKKGKPLEGGGGKCSAQGKHSAVFRGPDQCRGVTSTDLLCERPLEEEQGDTTQRISIHLKHLLSLKNILIH